MVKLQEQTVNLWQLVLSVLSMLAIVAATFYGVKDQVTRNEERIQALQSEIEKTQARVEENEGKINGKLDNILNEVVEVRIALERKQDRH